MGSRWLICAVLIGCGKVRFDPLADATPRAIDGALGAFATPTPIVELMSGKDQDDPTLTGDQLEIYFETTRNNSFDIYTSSRPTIDSPWAAATLAVAFDSADGEACPEISPDGLTMMFSSARPGGKGGYDLYIATRASRSSGWSAPALVPELNSTGDDYCAVIADSGLEVGFHSERAGGPGNRDLYRATRPTLAAPWATPILISELDTPGNDESAFFLPGDLDFMFGSERAGGRDIYIATRPAVGQPFGTPVPVASLNSTSDDSDPWLSPDGHTMVFASSRTGISEIFQATR